MSADLDPCPSCGAQLGGRAGCQSAFDELSALSWTNPARGRMHNTVVDTYAMQHPEEYGHSAKSYIRHLSALCCLVEHPGDHRLYWTLPANEAGPPIPAKPGLLSKRGEVTIADVRGVADDTFPSAVERWAANVWAAYAPQHELARSFLAAIAATLRKADGR